VNGVDLFRLGRKLTKFGVRSLPESGFRALPVAVRMVVVDVAENPASTISQIVERTGFPQSHVSAAVARLREEGVFITTVDPKDKRCTLVSASPQHVARAREAASSLPPIDSFLSAALVESLGDEGLDRLPEALAALNTLQQIFLRNPDTQ
jgi:DNA-binding MarR family transcriptional regulator